MLDLSNILKIICGIVALIIICAIVVLVLTFLYYRKNNIKSYETDDYSEFIVSYKNRNDAIERYGILPEFKRKFISFPDYEQPIATMSNCLRLEGIGLNYKIRKWTRTGQGISFKLRKRLFESPLTVLQEFLEDVRHMQAVIVNIGYTKPPIKKRVVNEALPMRYAVFGIPLVYSMIIDQLGDKWPKSPAGLGVYSCNEYPPIDIKYCGNEQAFVAYVANSKQHLHNMRIDVEKYLLQSDNNIIERSYSKEEKRHISYIVSFVNAALHKISSSFNECMFATGEPSISIGVYKFNQVVSSYISTVIPYIKNNITDKSLANQIIDTVSQLRNAFNILYDEAIVFRRDFAHYDTKCTPDQQLLSWYSHKEKVGRVFTLAVGGSLPAINEVDNIILETEEENDLKKYSCTVNVGSCHMSAERVGILLLKYFPVENFPQLFDKMSTVYLPAFLDCIDEMVLLHRADFPEMVDMIARTTAHNNLDNLLIAEQEEEHAALRVLDRLMNVMYPEKSEKKVLGYKKMHNIFKYKKYNGLQKKLKILEQKLQKAPNLITHNNLHEAYTQAVNELRADVDFSVKNDCLSQGNSLMIELLMQYMHQINILCGVIEGKSSPCYEEIKGISTESLGKFICVVKRVILKTKNCMSKEQKKELKESFKVYEDKFLIGKVPNVYFSVFVQDSYDEIDHGKNDEDLLIQ